MPEIVAPSSKVRADGVADPPLFDGPESKKSDDKGEEKVMGARE